MRLYLRIAKRQPEDLRIAALHGWREAGRVMPESHLPHRTRRDVPETDDVLQFLDVYALALLRGDARAIAAMWEAPALVVSDAGAQTVASTAEVERFFDEAKDQYAARGISGTHPEVQRLEWATDRIAIARVWWPYIDDRGRQVGAESATYTLRRDDDGALRLRVAVMHGDSPADPTAHLSSPHLKRDGITR
jgi:ketosteroid isomerase-like protein